MAVVTGMVTVVGTVVRGGGGVGGGGGGVGGGATTVVGAVVVALVETAALVLGTVLTGLVAVVPGVLVVCSTDDVADVESFERPMRKAMATPASPATRRSNAASQTGSGTARRPRLLGPPGGITRVGSEPATIVGASLSVGACSPESAWTSSPPSAGRASGSFASEASAIGNRPHFCRNNSTSCDMRKNLDCSSCDESSFSSVEGMSVLFMGVLLRFGKTATIRGLRDGGQQLVRRRSTALPAYEVKELP